jgi:hypothetical protein
MAGSVFTTSVTGARLVQVEPYAVLSSATIAPTAITSSFASVSSQNFQSTRFSGFASNWRVTPGVELRNAAGDLTLPAANQTQFWSGTESSLKLPALGVSQNWDSAAPVASSAAGPGSTPTSIPAATAMAQGAKSAGADTAADSARMLTLPTDPAKNIALSWRSASGVDGNQELVLQLKADGTVRSLPLQIAFDPAAVQVLGLQEGAYFKRNGANTTFSSSVDAQKGRIFVTAARNDAAGAPAGEFAVLSIKVRPIGPGAAGQGNRADWKVISAEPIVSSGERPTVVLPAPFDLSSGGASAPPGTTVNAPSVAK